MNLFSNDDKAYDCAMRRWFKQKSNDLVYVYRIQVARREMWAVLSAAEIEANKISAKRAWTAVDGRYGLADAKRKIQERDKENPKLPLEITAMRGLRSYYRAKEKLEKMERGANAPERQPELDTTKA